MSTPNEEIQAPKLPPGCLMGFIALLVGISPALFGPVQVAQECGSNASESTCAPYMWPFLLAITLPIGLFMGIAAISKNTKYKAGLNSQQTTIQNDNGTANEVPPAVAQVNQGPNSASVISFVCSGLSFIFSGIPILLPAIALLFANSARKQNDPQANIALILASIMLGINILSNYLMFNFPRFF